MVFFLTLLSTATAQAQSQYHANKHYFEAGFLFGGTNYSGDIAERDIVLKETHLGYGAYARYFLSGHFSLKAHLFSGAISGDDANSKDPGRRRRSFRFGTDILETGIDFEWHILGNGSVSSTGIHKRFFSPFVYLGIGGTFSGAKAEFYGAPEDRNVFLVIPLPENNLNQKFLIAPMGVGIRADINETLVLGGEIGWRPVFSDDLDGIRLNGNPNANDWYYFGGITASFVINKPKKH